jgi:hypothetical protein
MPRILDFANPLIVRNPDGQEYLRRYFLLETKWLRVYLHRIGGSDVEPCMHDHPWRFVSFILRGGYIEHTPDGVFKRRAGNMTYYPDGWLHRLELTKPAWTLLIGGKDKRVWGFMTPTGWKSFEDYNRDKETAARAAVPS